MGEHGVGPKRDGAAIGLDGAKRLVLRQGRVPAREEALVFPVPGHGLVRDDRGQRGDGQDDENGEKAAKKPAHVRLDASLIVSELPGPPGV